MQSPPLNELPLVCELPQLELSCCSREISGLALPAGIDDLYAGKLLAKFARALPVSPSLLLFCFTMRGCVICNLQGTPWTQYSHAVSRGARMKRKRDIIAC